MDVTIRSDHCTQALAFVRRGARHELRRSFFLAQDSWPCAVVDSCHQRDVWLLRDVQLLVPPQEGVWRLACEVRDVPPCDSMLTQRMALRAVLHADPRHRHLLWPSMRSQPGGWWNCSRPTASANTGYWAAAAALAASAAASSLRSDADAAAFAAARAASRHISAELSSSTEEPASSQRHLSSSLQQHTRCSSTRCSSSAAAPPRPDGAVPHATTIEKATTKLEAATCRVAEAATTRVACITGSTACIAFTRVAMDGGGAAATGADPRSATASCASIRIGGRPTGGLSAARCQVE